MALQYRDIGPTLPSIRVPGSNHFRRHHDAPFPRSPAMSIPNLKQELEVPPPLPPPRLPFGDSSFHSDDMKRDRREYSHGPSTSFMSSYGSMASSFQDERPLLKRRDTGSTNGDEGYASYASTDRSRDSLPSFQHNKLCYFQSPADIHSDSMKKMLDPIRTFDKSPPRSLLNSAVSEPSRLSQLSMTTPVQLPIHSRGALDSPAVFSAAVSPRSVPYHRTPTDHLSPIEGSDFDRFDRSPRYRSRRNNSDDAGSTQGSYEFHGVEEMEMDDARSEDAHAHVGQKRRAASPPMEDRVHPLPVKLESGRRRDVGSRGSPTPRLSTIPQGASVSPMSTAPVSRSNSYLSGASLQLTSINTATTPYDHRSPGGISPTSSASPYITPASLNHSPRVSLSGRAPAHSRNVSGTSPRKMQDLQKPSGTKLQGFLMCECCPKKPKKFETAEELSAHASEKQFGCSFCGNRFKNKNEAERHQNSLHVRRHSWSCSALSGYERAFHDSTNRPGEADSCGYCGDEFSRSGHGPGTGALSGGVVPRRATEQDWEERIRHLQEVHKFRECNASKKFFRADHFRQHLKHSHAGTSGKWTNMLENACMLDEDPTPR